MRACHYARPWAGTRPTSIGTRRSCSTCIPTGSCWSRPWPPWSWRRRSECSCVASDWDGFFGNAAGVIAIVLIVGSLLYLLQRWIAWYSTNFVVTTDRCIYREGIFSKKGVDIPLERINTVFFNQNIFERMVRAGDLTIESAGEMGVQRFEDVRDPVIGAEHAVPGDGGQREPEVRPGPCAPRPARRRPSSVADELTKLVDAA